VEGFQEELHGIIVFAIGFISGAVLSTIAGFFYRKFK